MTDDRRRTPQYVNMIITVVAVVLTIVLTAVAFWLSYEHLHDVAADHGLNGVRAWAWPSTLDAFIVIGEILILRASLARAVDKWAIFLTIIGSVGSIVLNVTGVGTNGDTLDYTVAAVPPVAALLAFGILMRQLHRAIKAYMGPVITPGARTVPPGVLTFDDRDIPILRDEPEAETDPDEYSEPGEDAMTYRSGDEDGMDADLGYLRGYRADLVITDETTADVPPQPAVPPWVAEELDRRRAAVPEDNRVAAGDFLVPGDLADALRNLPDTHAGRLRRDALLSPYVPPPVSPELSTGDTALASQNGHPVPDSVPPDVQPVVPSVVPPKRPSRRGTGTGVTGQVRDLLAGDASLTDDQLRDKFPTAPRNSVNKSIRRVRRERGEIA